MPVVSLYAALLAMLYAALSVRSLRLRRWLRIAIGDSGDERMLRGRCGPMPTPPNTCR
ncbi:hypothetical protein KTQ42_20690 [Noviherbaspirillum sp. L7-7A]|nr:hypothetical protein [Noviherbaspirillum sp. L7-7A]MBV0881703.1 hypothetical protein [Noviherbaspirillum sp. L7-7A]